MVSSDEQKRLLDKAKADGAAVSVDLILYDDQGKTLAQKRTANRRLFPNCWEFPGGHVEDGELFEDTLKREMKEELDIDVAELRELVGQFDWQTESGQLYRYFAFTAETAGEPKNMEPDKTSEIRWIGQEDADLFLENRESPNKMHTFVTTKVFRS